jgi:predicted 2-oxoglutarate/Fe(II)-dependent dioxygenase YbiX
MNMAALAELRQRASAQDAEAQHALGVRLMTGDGVEPDADEGAALLALACGQGSADAAAFLATVEAMEAGRPQSWDRAFDYLQLAAERGSAPARAQLALLSREPGLAAEAESGAPAGDVWKRMRTALDLAALTTPPAKRSLSDTPRIRVVEGFATAAECDWAIERARGSLKRAMVVDQFTGAFRPHDDRTNEAVELTLAQMDVVLQILRARIATATNLPVPVFEPPQIMHYSVGQEFKPHFDFLTDAEEGWAAQMRRFGQRIATFLLFLNEDFDGGETDFPSARISHRGGRGDAIFWANVDENRNPDRLTFHAGRPPTRGEKWIMSQWIRDRTPGPPED